MPWLHAGTVVEEVEDPLVRPSAEQPSFGSEALEQLSRLVLSPPVAAGATAGKGGSGRRRGGSGNGSGKARGRAAGNGGGAVGGSAAVAAGRGMIVVVLDEMDGLLNNTASGSGGNVATWLGLGGC